MLNTKLTQTEWLQLDSYTSTVLDGVACIHEVNRYEDEDKSDNVTTDDGYLHVTFYGVRFCFDIGEQARPMREFRRDCKAVLKALQVTGFEDCFLNGN